MLSGIRASLKWKAFSLLNRLADIRSQLSNDPVIYPPAHQTDNGHRLIWVFCSTIGEVNACLPFLRSLGRLGKLALITDHNCYRDSYQQNFPDAYVVELTGRVSDARFLVEQLPPSLFIICEIPAMPSDAPCRLSYGLLREAKATGARIHLVNAWLYGYLPACRMDSLEVRLFRKEYLDTFDTIGAQNEQIRTSLVQAGAKRERIFVTGNMKFDAIQDVEIRLGDETARAALSCLLDSQSPIIVAGCLADIDECYTLFDAILLIRQVDPHIRFVIAPRHPENHQFMQSLTKRLEQSALAYKLKSRLKAGELDRNTLLILDTFGELKSFYSIATICYVGCNHNVLEPLAFGKTTVVSGDWNALYPSYPVYQLTREKELIRHVEGANGIRDVILEYTSGEQSEKDNSQRIVSQLQSLSGAVDRTLNVIGLDQHS